MFLRDVCICINFEGFRNVALIHNSNGHNIFPFIMMIIVEYTRIVVINIVVVIVFVIIVIFFIIINNIYLL